MSRDIFIIDKKYMDILQHSNISISDVLKKASLPEDLFSHKTSKINSLYKLER